MHSKRSYHSFSKSKFYLLGLAFGLGIFSLAAQDLPRTVIGNSGDYYDNLIFGSLHFTVGEIAVAEYGTDVQVGEGFHRSYYDLLVSSENILPANWEVKIYPNPTVDQVQIQLPTDSPTQVFLYDSAGRLIGQREDIQYQSIIDFSRLPAGSYHLQLRDNNGRQGTFQILKLSY
ncbi:MAG: T9SS type A sorting domain-containing protein [Bacteroidota bacterium]